MSRKDSPSLQVRGVPREVLEQLHAAAHRQRTTKNALAIAAIAGYADGRLTPRAQPPPFDPNRPKAAPYPPGTGDLAISAIPKDVFDRFTARARQDGWYSKNALIVELLRDELRLE